jgi:hypothetical protein
MCELNGGVHELTTKAFAPVRTLNADAEFTAMQSSCQSITFQVEMPDDVSVVRECNKPALPSPLGQGAIQELEVYALWPVRISGYKRYEMVFASA